MSTPRIQRLVRESASLAQYRKQSYEQLRGTLDAREHRWLQTAFRLLDDSLDWLVRYPTLVLPVLEVYPFIRSVYPDEPLILARTTYQSDAEGTAGDGTAPSRELAEAGQIEATPPEIIVDREWFGVWMAPRAEIDAGGAEILTESNRLYAELGDHAHGRAEFWWGRTGDRGGWRIAFAPYVPIDIVDTPLMSDAEIQEHIDVERTKFDGPPEVIEFPVEDEGGGQVLKYQPGSQEYLHALVAEQARRAHSHLSVTDLRLPWTTEESAALRLSLEALFDDSDLTDAQRAQAEESWHRIKKDRAKRSRELRQRLAPGTGLPHWSRH